MMRGREAGNGIGRIRFIGIGSVLRVMGRIGGKYRIKQGSQEPDSSQNPAPGCPVMVL